MSGLTDSVAVMDKDMLDKIRFSFSSRNAESLVSGCRAHVFVTAMKTNPGELASMDWKYVLSGIVAMLRNRVVSKKGAEWQLSMCIVDQRYGVSVWKEPLGMTCSYSVIGDRFHVFELHSVEGIFGVLFESEVVAAEFQATYTKWNRERCELSDRGKDLEPLVPRFTRDMISKPCNFQHVSGSQALEQILDIEKVKSDVQLKIQSVGPKRESVDGAVYQKPNKKLRKAATMTSARFEGYPIPIPTVPSHRVTTALRRACSEANVTERQDFNGHFGAVGGTPLHASVSGVEGVGDSLSHQEIDSAITSLSGDEAVEEEHSWLDDVLKSVAIETSSTAQTYEPKEFQRTFVYSTIPKPGKSRSTSTAV